MHDARSQGAAHVRQRIAIVMEKRIDQGAAAARIVRGTAAGVHGHACGFIDHGKVVVLIDDRERDVFWRGFERRGLGLAGDLYPVAWFHAIAGLLHAAVHVYLTVVDQELDT